MNQSQRNYLLNTELVGKVRFTGEMMKLPVNKPMKEGKSKKWKSRYFVLADNLAYYEDESKFKASKDKHKGVICLDYATVEQSVEDPLIFVLRTPAKTLALKCATVAETDAWIKRLRATQRAERDTDEMDEKEMKKLLYLATSFEKEEGAGEADA